MKSNHIKIVLLSGGIGKRLFPITTDKSLLSFNGLPLIIHQINQALTAGLNEFVVVTNPTNNEPIKSLISAINGAHIDVVVQQEAQGMANAILSAKEAIGNHPFIVFGSDDILDFPIFDLILKEFNSNKNYDTYIAAFKVTNYFPGGYLDVGSDGEIKRIVEKPSPGKEPSNLVNIVFHLHTKPKDLFEYLRKTESNVDDVYEKSLNDMMDNKFKMKAIVYEGFWQPIKYPWHILETMDHFINSIEKIVSPSAKISPSAVIDGEVIISDGVRIMEGAVIRGPSYIGENSVIGNSVLIRNSHVGRNSVVGFGSEIKHSYIGDGCWFHTNYIGDSVIEENCSFGAGAVTANFRTDEQDINVKVNGKIVNSGHDKLGTFVGKDSRIGINTSIMPGIKIGTNCFIGPHVYLNQDVDSNLIVMEERSYNISSNIIKRTKKRDAGKV